MGIAFNGKVYSNGVTPIGSGTPVDIGFVDISSATLPIKRVNVTSILELLKPGIYKTNLGNLQKFNNFNGFLEHAFDISAYDVPVVIFVPSNNLMDMTSPTAKALAFLAYTQYHKGDSNTNLYNAYTEMSSMLIPEFSSAELKDFKFSTKLYPDSSQCDSIGMFDLSTIQKIVGVQYKGKTVLFCEPANRDSSMILYVGGYGFKVYYPHNVIYMKSYDAHGGFISVRRYEEPLLKAVSGSDSNYQRGYSFPGYPDPKNPNGTTYTLAWNTYNPFSQYDDNIPYDYTHTIDVNVSFGLPYNPYIPITIGEAPFFEKITLDSSFETLNHIGIPCDINGKFSTTMRIADVDYSLGDYFSLPTGEYKFSSTYSIDNVPISSGLTGLKVYTPDDGTTIIQEAFSDPTRDVNSYHRFKRLCDSKGNFSGWIGMTN